MELSSRLGNTLGDAVEVTLIIAGLRAKRRRKLAG
jgi:hypothetical protein